MNLIVFILILVMNQVNLFEIANSSYDHILQMINETFRENQQIRKSNKRSCWGSFKDMIFTKNSILLSALIDFCFT